MVASKVGIREAVNEQVELRDGFLLVLVVLIFPLISTYFSDLVLSGMELLNHSKARLASISALQIHD
uniref:Uncharacterized protein n=1 Tax=Utricularia reniformis TaxID=192314 RepID=A0A1Y0AZB5_9LAMI|nr:hypothetical protein AEK19_MT0244 [Utricularia reniformis]ART30522.1 hypothetical protein AEK19_MT0244 [Utricularia reniformis]